jgi:predicted transcriptional regulator of viral defense system
MQRFTATDTEVIARAQRKRRDVIVLREDREWLSELSPRPQDMLLRMAHRGALLKLGAGRYAIPALGSTSLSRVSWQPLLHARLGPHGDYYLAGFSALEEHRLTDLSDRTITAVTGFSNRQVLSGTVRVGGRPLHAVYTRRRVFGERLGIEAVRLSRTGSYRRSDPTRTLVDCLWHPELCGSTETWVSAWGRAHTEGRLDPGRAGVYALALGPAVARRVGYTLELIGYGEQARTTLPPSVRRGDREVALVKGLPAGEADARDPFWRVTLNVPRTRLEGWLSYGK